MSAEEPISNTVWSREQEKAFENALADYDEDGNDRWQKIAADVPGKTADDVRQHFELLMEDISCIESGRVPLPNYVSSSDVSEHTEDRGGSKKCGHSGIGNGDSRHGGKSSRADLERRKGIAWTEDEHRLFLLGLEKYGKGDWRSISRNFVISRTPTQVASHAQKYFIRMNSMNKDRRRSSIHDITSVANAQKSPQGTTTGQTNGTSVLSSKSGKQTPLRSSAPAKVGVYETPTVGQPIGRPVVSAVGTPVHIPTPSHMVYGVHAPIAGTVVTGDPMVSAPMTYPMPHKSAKR